jgi:Flp pilus assembly protein TadG
MVALSLSVLLGFGALVLNVSYGRYVQQELQNASDAAAHAAVLKLDGTSAGVTNAHNMAVTLAGKNTAAGTYVHLNANLGNDPNGDVVTGYYNSSTNAFTPSMSATTANAVKVRAQISSLNLLFNPMNLPGMEDTVAVSAQTQMTASPPSGAGAVNCFIPLAIPECLISYHGGVNALQNVTLKLNPAGIDNAGWARPFASPSASWTTSQINNCNYSGSVAVGDPVYLQNGSVNTAYSDIVTAVQNSTTTWTTSKWGAKPTQPSNSQISPSKWGHTYEGVVMVFDGGSSYCTGSGGAFNSYAPVKAFMWGAVYDVWSGSASTRTIKMRLDPMTVHAVGTRGGGPDYGIQSVYRPPQMFATN